MLRLQLFLLMAYPLLLSAQVIMVESQPNATVSVEGQLEDGTPMDDLSWAWSSQNACFVETQKHKFTGHHVLFQTELPRRAELFIKVIPKDKNANFSLYAYSGNGQSIVPALRSCVSCEADYKWDYKYRGKTQDHTRSVSLRAVNNPYTVTIGVVGADGLNSGAFTLELRLEGGEQPLRKVQMPLPTYQLPKPAAVPISFEGRLEDGKPLHDLSWAWNSQNACFVAPRKEAFSGHHLLHLTEIPPHSELNIELTPKDPKANMSLYAYSHGGDKYRMVPELSSCVSCEADFQSTYGNSSSTTRTVSLRAVNNPYKVVIGVAGANGLDKGDYTLSISTQ